MNEAIFIAVLMTIIATASPILIVALGELVVEKSGVLNLGLEGMMLIGAVSGFIMTFHGGAMIGIGAAMLAGMAAALLFGFLTLTLAANQVATGLALTLFGVGLSALLGEAYIGHIVAALGPIFPPILADDPILGLLFGFNIIVYFSLISPFFVVLFLRRTRAGLILRAIGENAESAHALGYPVIAMRYGAIAFGGAMAGLGGCYYAIVLTPMWAENITAGRGWIALALVVFAGWLPYRLMFGAYLFGTVITLELHSQAAGLFAIPAEFFAAMPYLATLIALTLLSRRRTLKAQAPAGLGKTFKLPA